MPTRKQPLTVPAAVALRRLRGEADDSPDDESYDDEFNNEFSEDEQLAVDQQCNAKRRRAQ